MSMKICTKCNTEYPKTLKFFHNNKRRYDGFNGICKKCINNQVKSYNYLETKKEIRQNYYESNKENISNNKKAYYIKNKEMINAKYKEYYNSKLEYHRNRSKGKRSYNPERNRESFENKYNNCPVFNLSHKYRARLNNVLRYNHFKKSNNSIDFLGCCWEDLTRHLHETFEENYGIAREHIPWKEVHIDHILPASLAMSQEDIKELFHYKNLQLLFKEDNLKKTNKIDWKIS